MIWVVIARFCSAVSGFTSSSCCCSSNACCTFCLAEASTAVKSAVAVSPNWATANPSSCSLDFSESSSCTSSVPARRSSSSWVIPSGLAVTAPSLLRLRMRE